MAFVHELDEVLDHSHIIFLKGLVVFAGLQILVVQQTVEPTLVLVLCKVP